jgi:hypothetical protein
MFRSISLVSLFAIAIVACAPAPSASDAGDASPATDSAAAEGGAGAKPTCELIAERCHAFDGVNTVATMCHRTVEAPTATEAACAAIRDNCLASCPEGDGGHAHDTDAAAGHDH